MESMDLSVLKYGLSKKQNAQIEKRNPGSIRPPLIRDHYERWAYCMKLGKRESPRPFVDDDALIIHAITVPRNIPLGIVDTLARDYITYWFPELETLRRSLSSNPSDAGAFSTQFDCFKALTKAIRTNVLEVLGQIPFHNNDHARTIKDAIQSGAREMLCLLYDHFEEGLNDRDKQRYDPRQCMPEAGENVTIRKHTDHPRDFLTEARILDSSLAWDLNDAPLPPPRHSPLAPPLSPLQRSRKRRHTELSYSTLPKGDEPDPADNGQVWDSPRLEVKRRKIETRSIRFKSTISSADMFGTSSMASSRTRQVLSIRDSDMIDLTGDGEDKGNSDEEEERYTSHFDTGGLLSTEGYRVPGAIEMDSTSHKRDSQQCMTM